MSSVESLEIIAERLNAYHGQLTALAQALGALRDVSDHMIVALASDHAAILSHVAAAAQTPAQAAHALIARVADALEPQVAEIDPVESDPVEIRAIEIQPLEIQPLEILALEILAVEAVAEAASDAVEPVLLATEAAAEGQTDVQNQTEIATTLACEPAETAEAAVERSVDCGTSAAIVSEADRAIEPGASAGIEAAETGAATAGGGGKVVNLASRRRAMLDKFPARRAMAVVASVAVTVTAGMGFHELMQTELGQRLLDLGTCDGDMLSANRDCALLAWLML